jgi:hypothetical protein
MAPYRFHWPGYSGAFALTVLCVSGCARSVSVEGLSEQAILLNEIDKAWEGGRYVPAYRTLSELNPDRAGTEVLWRKSRLAVSMGLSEEDPTRAQEHFAAARGAAWACLDASPDFSHRRSESGWEVAVAEVPSERAACLTWGAIAWTRWLEHAGPAGAAMDLGSIRALNRRAAVVGGDPDLLQWNSAVLEAIAAPTVTPELVAELDRARTNAPAELARAADWVLLGLVPLGEQEQALQVAADVTAVTAISPESRNAQKRLLRWQEGAQDLSRY